MLPQSELALCHRIKKTAQRPAIIASPLSSTNSRRARPAIQKDDHPRKRPCSQVLARWAADADRLGAMALDEAGRPVPVREGDKVSEIPAMQALLRTMFRAAAQGDTKAGRQLLEVIARAESARTEKALEFLQFSHQYIEKHARIFEKHEREGLSPPDIYPHPDDFIINEATGEVTIDGPKSKDEAGARKAVRQHALKS